jgi:hypothetical protein
LRFNQRSLLCSPRSEIYRLRNHSAQVARSSLDLTCDNAAEGPALLTSKTHERDKAFRSARFIREALFFEAPTNRDGALLKQG